MAPQEPGSWQPRSGMGVGVTAGGGVSNFTNGTMQNNTSAQGMWDVRAAFGTRSYIGAEAAYVGAAGSISGLGLNTSNTLVRNGIEGTLRLNLPLEANGTLLEPYIFGGVGYDHYMLANAPAATADLNRNDSTLTVPAGIGFNMSYRGFMADARFTYKPTYFNSLVTGNTNAGLTNWILGAQLGYEF